MNKYQDSIVVLTEIFDKYINASRKHLNALNELVNRATPKKPKMIADKGYDGDVSSHLCCQTCAQPIMNVWSKREYKPQFCHYCGQAIDWLSDSND